MEGDEDSLTASSPPPKRPHGGPWGLQPYIPPPPRPYIAPRDDGRQTRQRRRLLFKFRTRTGKAKYKKLIKKLEVDRQGKCSGDDGDSSADGREESEGESLWERAERLGEMSMEMTDEEATADKTPTRNGTSASGRKRSLSALSGSSEEEPLMAWKRAKQE
ncbi:hypothetical protein EG328_005750 [Venturia inaequalis]|uniref:Uncharacterized protein n=1 Tax=Venturia inaequalis TaxID=5025 RepID=A0A8H3UL32_VENIN|nr:hypothetical protein EG328_005750 [Venturia inaequalis]